MVVRLDPFHCIVSVLVKSAPFSVRVVAALPGASVAGANGCCKKGTGLAVVLIPVPVSVAGIGESAVARVTFSVALRLPAADAVKTTLILQDPPAATLPHVFV